LDRFLVQTRHFRDIRVPAFRAYQKKRIALADAERTRLRLSEYRPE
jgi:hypothetical protein